MNRGGPENKRASRLFFGIAYGFELMLPNLRGHKWELRGVRRIFQIKNAKPHRHTDDHVRRSGNAIEIRNALSTKGA
jgi:hypothetical protein